ncbi:MAG: hypothetical protein H0W06_13365 [Chloroflexia bacterium]|nr:hypothetical protein [Chloroflexia bacterium]
MKMTQRPGIALSRRVRRAAVLSLLGSALLVLAGCGPEAARVRGGDNGAQVGFDAPRDLDLLGDTPRDDRIYEPAE